MAALLCEIQPGDEVILPSFTFVSTANAFVLRGAKIIFVDSKANHPNMDESLLEELITPKTKAIVVVHYGGVACEMDAIMEIANRHGLLVIEDAAQAVDSFYKGKALGSIGHLGTMSFHETKNIQCGEGGMLVINDSSMIQRAEILWEKGTERVAYARGEINKYGWVDVGSSFLPSELNSAYLWAQLENLDQIQKRRKDIWEDYLRYFTRDSSKSKILSPEYLYKYAVSSMQFSALNSSSDTKGLNNNKNSELQSIPEHCSLNTGNWHIFYLLFPSLESRTAYANALREKGILAVFHYQSLHKSEFAKKHFPDQYARELPNSDKFSDCLLRLPMFYELPELSQSF